MSYATTGRRPFRRVLSLLLALLLLTAAASLASCGAASQPVLQLGNHSISLQMYEFILSVNKGIYRITDNSALDAYADAACTVTYDEVMTAKVLEDCKYYLAALQLFDERGLSLSDADEDEIDAYVQTLIKERADGSKSTFNSMLASYGANEKIFREYLEIARKLALLREDLYGKNGSLVSEASKENYLNEHYVAFKQIMVAKFDYVYETDENGDDIYYNEDKTVAYNKELYKHYDRNGDPVKDASGNVMYFHADNSIAYDTENGVRAYRYDESGNPLTANYSGTELIERKGRAEALAAQAGKGNYTRFEELMLLHSDNYDEETSANAFYLDHTVSYAACGFDYFDDLADAVVSVDVGETAVVETDYGFHVLMRYETEKGAYDEEKLKDWFTDAYYNVFDFYTNLTSTLLDARLAESMTAILVDGELASTLSMKTVATNLYFY